MLAVLAIPFVASAHMAGQSFERKVGTYLLDAGCDTYEFLVGKGNYCSFALIEGADTQAWVIANYDSMRVIISQTGSTALLDETVNAVPHTFTFLKSFSFESAGDYTMFVEFLKGGKAIAETNIPITALGSKSAGGWLTTIFSLVQIALVVTLFSLIGWAMFGPLLKKKSYSPPAP